MSLEEENEMNCAICEDKYLVFELVGHYEFALSCECRWDYKKIEKEIRGKLVTKEIKVGRYDGLRFYTDKYGYNKYQFKWDKKRHYSYVYCYLANRTLATKLGYYAQHDILDPVEFIDSKIKNTRKGIDKIEEMGSTKLKEYGLDPSLLVKMPWSDY